jgi:hypothetical protein
LLRFLDLPRAATANSPLRAQHETASDGQSGFDSPVIERANQRRRSPRDYSFVIPTIDPLRGGDTMTKRDPWVAQAWLGTP